MRISVGQGRWISIELSSVCCCKYLFLQALTEYTALPNKPVPHPAVTQHYLFSFPACLGLKSQLKTSLFCLCLIVFSPFPSAFAAVFRLSCVRVDVRGNKVSLCDVPECFAPQPPSPCTTGGCGCLPLTSGTAGVIPVHKSLFRRKDNAQGCEEIIVWGRHRSLNLLGGKAFVGCHGWIKIKLLF